MAHHHHFCALADVSKELTAEAVAAKLDIKALPNSSDVFRLADLRISFGNSDPSAVVEAIIAAVELKYQTSSSLPTRVEVFYNHQSPSSSTQLLCSLPPDRHYYAACVSGSFYNRLFPAASLHLLHCSDSLQWLSKVPDEVLAVTDRNSSLSSDEEVVANAYKRQYEKDMECFLNARSQELVPGGLMVILVSGRPDGASHAQASANIILDLLGSCLFDMANKGEVSEGKVKSFKLPIYTTCRRELEEAVSRNGRFSIERMETVVPRNEIVQEEEMSVRAKAIASHLRGGVEGYVKKQFGDEITMDHLFQLLANKIQESPLLLLTGKTADLFVLLKRNAN